MRVPLWKLFLLVLCCDLIGVCLLGAHEGHTHVMGTVTALTDGQMVVQTKDGRSETIRLDRNTRYRATGVARSGGTVSVGDRVVVEITEEAGGLLAAEVRFAPGAAPAR
jgi:hypothetical protein